MKLGQVSNTTVAVVAILVVGALVGLAIVTEWEQAAALAIPSVTGLIAAFQATKGREASDQGTAVVKKAMNGDLAATMETAVTAGIKQSLQPGGEIRVALNEAVDDGVRRALDRATTPASGRDEPVPLARRQAGASRATLRNQ